MITLDLAAQKIEAAGLAARGDDLFFDTLPEQRSRYVSLRSYGSSPPHLTSGLETGKQFLHEQPRFQCVVCDANYQAAHDLIYTIYNLFLNTGRSETGCVTVGHIRPLQVPFHSGRDKNDRHMFSFNAELYAISNLGE